MSIYLRAVAALVSDSLTAVALGVERVGDITALPAYSTADLIGYTADRVGRWAL